MKRRDTRQRKQTLAGLKTTAGMDWMLGTLVRVIHSGKPALDAVMLDMGRMVAESVGTGVWSCILHRWLALTP